MPVVWSKTKCEPNVDGEIQLIANVCFQEFYKHILQAHSTSTVYKHILQAHSTSTFYKHSLQAQSTSTVYKYSLQAFGHRF